MSLPARSFGSYCIDHAYSEPHFAASGETLTCSNYQVHPGGKVRHVGEDGRWLLGLMPIKNIDVGMMKIDPGPTGHANIQVTLEGEDSIVLFGGANRTITKSHIDEVLEDAQSGEFLLLQNEISALDYLLDQA